LTNLVVEVVVEVAKPVVVVVVVVVVAVVVVVVVVDLLVGIEKRLLVVLLLSMNAAVPGVTHELLSQQSDLIFQGLDLSLGPVTHPLLSSAVSSSLASQLEGLLIIVGFE
jgi:hypothetical protein